MAKFGCHITRLLYFQVIAKIAKLWIVAFLILQGISALGQDTLPARYEIKQDTSSFQILDTSFWQMLVDTIGKFSFEEVRTVPPSDWRYFSKKDSNTSVNIFYTYWLRFSFKNSLDREISLNLPINADYSKLYVIRNYGNPELFENGVFVPRSQTNGIRFLRYIPLKMSPREVLTIYNQVRLSIFTSASRNLNTLSPGFGFLPRLSLTESKRLEEQYTRAVHDSILFGLLLFASILNLFFFLIVKERIYLYFSLYMACLGTGRMPDELYNVFLREYPNVLWTIAWVVWSLNGLFMTLFIRSLLQTRKYFPQWDKIMMALTWISLLPIAILFSVLPIFRFSDSELGTTLRTIYFALSSAADYSILIAFLLTISKAIRLKDALIIAVFPVFIFWILGDSLAQFYNHFYQTISIPGFIIWVHDSWFVMETICLSWLAFFFCWILLQRFRDLQKQMSNQALEAQKEKAQIIKRQKDELERTVETRTAELKQSLHNLQTTQAQLIQSEKMASLGEITAGIAHEIQNPLNFINNFAQVNEEFIDEVEDAIDKGKPDEAKHILRNLKDNQKKINQHGQRADSIVKGMLQHSRSSSRQKELTNVNELVDEYLRLSYHGWMAKDKSANIRLLKSFDPSIKTINVVPQDIGRVILNLSNNAFYVVSEKKKSQPNKFEPAVEVSTVQADHKIEIKIKDNGNGISKTTIKKIFQPFFTTKPAGQGTGLGLSMSFDIVKAHGGEIRVETEEGKGSSFIVELPYNTDSSSVLT
jgi:signal transduction histidine kinase